MMGKNEKKGMSELEQVKAQLKRVGAYLATFFKWVLFAVVTGLVLGVVGAAFHHGIAWATDVRQAHGWVLFLLPLAGLLIVFCYRATDMSDDKGTEYVIACIRDNKPLRLRTAPLIFGCTVLTHLCGGSAGREGAALQLGGTISNFIGHHMKLDEKDERVITMCGMAAGFSALFGTPMAAAVFAMEIISVGVMYYSALVPCVLSALLAQVVAMKLGVQPTAFSLGTDAAPGLTVLSLVQVAALGALCACVAILFCFAMHRMPGVYDRITQNPYLRVALGGGIVVAVTLLLGTGDYNGAGMDVISAAIGGTARPEAFLLKIALTALTLAAGYKGGEIVPCFFTGATFGCVAGGLLGLSPAFGAALGMVAVFCGVTNCPMTSILLSYELFGGIGVTYFALASAVSYMLSGYYSLYRAQKIVYSKLSPTFVDRETH